MQEKNRTWVEVNLDNVTHNYHEFKRHTNPAQVMCVIKANAYGHGSIALGRHLQKVGATFFGTANLDETLELCEAGITVPILVLNYISHERIKEALAYPNIRLTVSDYESAKRISACAVEQNTTACLHVKVDTGMTRVGFNLNELDEVKKINSLPNLEFEGFYSHLATADEVDTTYAQLQFSRYLKALKEIEDYGIKIKIRHICNSAGAINFKEMHLDMVRIGISLYGCYPAEEVDKTAVLLKPAMQYKTQIIRVNHVDVGVGISYGIIFKTERPSVIATIPVGYADGISRSLATKLKVLVNGKSVPVVGKICMDQCMVDVTDCGEVKMLDEVVVFGEQKGSYLPIEEIAKQMGTVNYEIMCMVQRRVYRHYTIGGEIVEIKNYLLQD